jgi:dTDP-4-dehydrorhamnose reductase
VGLALQREFPDATAWDFPKIDLTRPAELAHRIGALEPSCVLNAAAYTAVDRAETEDELAFKINGEAPGKLAEVCAQLRIPFVHYSTDYVFSGEGNQPWTENDRPAPVNVYGMTKLEGERAIARAGGSFLILRTSWAFAPVGTNFVATMLKLGAEKEEIRVVNDQFGAPNYAPYLARATREALTAALDQPFFPSGIYHLSSSGVTNWHEFAEAIFARARTKGIPLQVKKVTAIPTRDYPTPARRPSNSRLSTAKISERLGVTLPEWTQGLDEYFRNLKP